MAERLTLWTDRRTLAIATIVLAAVFFVALNVLAGASLKRARLDVTADGLYTLSEGTKTVLGAIDEPIRLRYYRSKRLEELGPYFASHAKRVDELLEHYARVSNGGLVVERYDPAPFSPEEDLAVADGIQALAFDNAGTLAYFGLAGVNSTDDRKAIPYLAPDRAAFLEYDLTRMVSDLARPEKAIVAVLGALPLQGDARTGFRPWLVMDALEQFFSVRSIGGEIDRIDEDVDILILAQPTDLDEAALHAVDQFVMRGGRVVAFVDPFAEVLSAGRPGGGGGGLDAIAPLLTAWGLAIADDAVVGDRRAATRVRALHNSRPVVSDYLPWLTLERGNFTADDAVSGNLQVIVMKSAGAIRASDDGETVIEPLIQTSPQAAEITVENVRFLPDPVALLRDFEPAGEPLVLAARVSGPVRSAFPDGPPDAVTDEAVRATHLAEPRAPLSAIIIADADLLADETWARQGAVLGQEYAVPTANNADLAVNAVESLAGGAALSGLRGRGITVRRFDVIDEMARQAEDRYRETEEALRARIDAIRAEIGALERRDQDSSLLITAEQQAAIETFRGEMLELRQQLRDVQYALRRDVERLKVRLEIVNIWAVPILVGVLALVLAAVRRRRAARFRAARAD